MHRAKQSFVVRLIAIMMAVALMIPVGASAAVPETAQPYASAYLSTFAACIYLLGTGEVRVYFGMSWAFCLLISMNPRIKPVGNV